MGFAPTDQYHPVVQEIRHLWERARALEEIWAD